MSSGSPHDALFRYVFSNVDEVRPLLRALLQGPFADAVDWSSLRLAPASFVDELLSDRQADLLFSVRVGAALALAFTLLEHQSTVPERMAYRMLEYVTRIWGRWLREAEPKAKLPRILPVVIYAGEKPWTAPTRLEDLVDGDTEPWVPRMEYIVLDLTRLSEPEIRNLGLGLFGELAIRKSSPRPRT